MSKKEGILTKIEKEEKKKLTLLKIQSIETPAPMFKGDHMSPIMKTQTTYYHNSEIKPLVSVNENEIPDDSTFSGYN